MFSRESNVFEYELLVESAKELSPGATDAADSAAVLYPVEDHAPTEPTCTPIAGAFSYVIDVSDHELFATALTENPRDVEDDAV